MFVSSTEPIPKLFVTYAHRDSALTERLEAHLGPLKQTSSLELWSDKRIKAGDDWEARIMTSLSEASIAVLVITADFLNSDFIQKREIPALLDRQATGNLPIIPILARACAWKLLPWLKRIQVRPFDAKPVWRKGGNADHELSSIAMEIEELAENARNAIKMRAQKNADGEKIEQQRRELDVVISDLARSTHKRVLDLDDEAIAAVRSEFIARAQAARTQGWSELQTSLMDTIYDITLNKPRKLDAESSRSFERYVRADEPKKP